MASCHFLESQAMSGSSKSNGVHYPIAPSSQVKFFFQNLIDLKEYNWTLQNHHKEEKAKMIVEIHKDVVQEEELVHQLSYRQALFNQSQPFCGPPNCGWMHGK